MSSVKQVLAPLLILMANQAHELARGVKRKGSRFSRQLEAGFFRRAITLAIIAFVAAGYQILPGGPAAARSRQDMVQRKLRGRKGFAAELADIPVTKKDVLPR